MFLLPGYEDMDGVLAAMRDAGVERVVLLSGSSAASGDTSNAVTAYMLRSEAAVKARASRGRSCGRSAFMSNALRWLDQLREGDVVREPFANVRGRRARSARHRRGGGDARCATTGTRAAPTS